MIGAITAGLFGGGVSTPAITPSYESIATANVGSGGTSYIEFTSIPSTFKHLQIRGISQTNRATYNTDGFKIVINTDFGSSYYGHILLSNPASPATNVISNGQALISELSTSTGVAPNVFGTSIIDVLDYQNSNKYKTVRFLSGADTNGAASGYAGWLGFGSGLWMSGTAISNIRLYPTFGTAFNQFTSFGLYGIKG